MRRATYHEGFSSSRAYQEMQPLRIPAGWSIGWNTLNVGMAENHEGIGGSSTFNATNQGRRFNIDVEYRPEFDPEGAFHLTVIYQPWPRSERGRRLTTEPFRFDGNAETVHHSETRSYAELVARLEHWIACCTVWEREGH